MSEPRVTIVAVPRERFSETERSLESIYAHTEMPFELVYVDGKAPRGVRRYLQESSVRRGFRHVRVDRFLSPNEARNIGLRFVKTEYVVFVDNDLIVSPGWLERLVACADETGAWLAGPLYFEGDPAERIIHMAGGRIETKGEPGSLRFETDHLHQGTKLDALDEPLERTQVDFIEFHCMLVRTEVFERIGTLDEQLMSTREHLDLCLRVREAGGEIWFEPGSEVTYSTPPPLAASDIPYFLVRWSDDWGTTSLRHFAEKYGLDSSYTARISILRNRRQVAFRKVRGGARKALGSPGERVVSKALLAVEPPLNRLLVKAQRAGSDGRDTTSS